MLKGIDPVLTPDLLRALAAMGHNEWVALVDSNFTGERLAKNCTYIRLSGVDWCVPHKRFYRSCH